MYTRNFVISRNLVNGLLLLFYVPLTYFAMRMNAVFYWKIIYIIVNNS